MDPSSYLDHALFQLTPTRTRCDLMIVAGGGVSERLASGLLEPFLSHLKSAKDQISKGGYSITLRPSTVHAPWFTKATLQRFVTFVSTPEVIERLATIEKEIVQIESSNQTSEKSNLVAEAEDGRVKRSITSSKLKDELSGTNQDGYEENSRVLLQRALDNRKAMLHKEQAMAYARALVAGFYPELMDDLICFADSFGASRLREACLNFLELCKQKNEDKLWMDEIAAMQVSSQPEMPYLRTSGIILAGEDDSRSKLNGLVDATISESTPSHASLDIGQDYSLPASGQTPTDGRSQIPMSWPNHLPQFIHNLQGHAFQQMPPYQGYPYPGMQVPSSYYPGNMQWPLNGDYSHIDHKMDFHKSSYKKKNKRKQSHVVQHSEENGSTASSESSYESDSEHMHKKKHGKKSSRKVVIRNINYITSNEDGEKGSITEGSLSNEEEFINGDSSKHKVKEGVASFERRHKSTSHTKQQNEKQLGTLNGSTDADSNGVKGTNNWDAFQNLLLRDDDSTLDEEKQSMKFQQEYIENKNFEDGKSNEILHDADVTKTKLVSDDSFIVTGRDLGHSDHDANVNFKEGKDEPLFIKKNKSTDEEFLFSQRNEKSDSYFVSTLSGNGQESSLTKCQKEEDWFIVNQSDKPENENQYQDFIMLHGVSISSSDTDYLHVEKNNKDIVADDSFMFHALLSQDQFNSVGLVSEIVDANEFTNSTQESSQKKTETLNPHEPDDLLMVLERDSAAEQYAAPLGMEMDYENNISLNEANKKLSEVEGDKNHLTDNEGADTKTHGVKTGKVSSKEVKSKALNAYLGKGKSDITSRNKALPGSRSTVTKGKSHKEEETRKRREELLIQRQKRIAERSTSKKTGSETKTSLTSAKKGNPKIHPSKEETKKLHKPVLRSSTIGRLAIARVTQQKVLPSQAKSGPTKKPSTKANAAPLQKTSGTEKKKQGPKEVKSSKEDAQKTKGKYLSDTNAVAKNETDKASVVLPIKSGVVQASEPNNNNIGLKDNGELSKETSEEQSRYLTSEIEIMHENGGQLQMNSSMPNHDHALGRNQSRVEKISDKLSSLPGDNQPQHNTDVTTDPTAELPSKPLIFTSVNSKDNQKIDDSNVIPPKVSEIQIFTPPPSNQVMLEPLLNRKKRNNDENSSKAAKGFRKLLFFGRRS